jgi:FkbM family methyltransferase
MNDMGTIHGGRWRKFARDVAVECFARQALPVKNWELRHFRRLIVGAMFRLEREQVVICRAGPAWLRFPMRLSWQAHMDYALGLYEPDVIRTLRKYLRQGDTCIDVGGHVGYLTIIMSHLVGQEGRVVTFEPVRETFETLEENVRLNGLKNTVLECAAVGESEERISLLCQVGQRLSWTASTSAYSVPGETSEISVPASSLDSYMQRTGLRPDLIKIDVEGAELRVLQGARQTLQSFRPVVLVEIHDLGTEHREGVLGLLENCGYAVRNLATRERELFCVAVPGRIANTPAGFSAGSKVPA